MSLVVTIAARISSQWLRPHPSASNFKFNAIWVFQRFLLRLVAIRSDHFAGLTDRKQFESRKNDRTMLLKKSEYATIRAKHFYLCQILHSEFEIVAQVQVAPCLPLTSTVLPSLPFSFAIDFYPSRVHCYMHRLCFERYRVR